MLLWKRCGLGLREENPARLSALKRAAARCDAAGMSYLQFQLKLYAVVLVSAEATVTVSNP